MSCDRASCTRAFARHSDAAQRVPCGVASLPHDSGDARYPNPKQKTLDSHLEALHRAQLLRRVPSHLPQGCSGLARRLCAPGTSHTPRPQFCTVDCRSRAAFPAQAGQWRLPQQAGTCARRGLLALLRRRLASVQARVAHATHSTVSLFKVRHRLWAGLTIPISTRAAASMKRVPGERLRAHFRAHRVRGGTADRRRHGVPDLGWSG